VVGVAPQCNPLKSTSAPTHVCDLEYPTLKKNEVHISEVSVESQRITLHYIPNDGSILTSIDS
jgi:hypothetical protein